jgi:hypothetical protein
MEKKPFRETKLGQFLANKAPKILDTVGDLLPDQGVIGIVKRLISNDPDIPEADRLEYEKLSMQFEKEMFGIETEDRKSARLREVEVARTIKHDFLMYVVGGVILAAFLVVVYASVFMDAGGETFVRISTMVETLTVAIVSYYYGSSKSSADKSKLLAQ